MADENLIEDGNSRNVAGAVTDDSAEEIRMLRIDDATKGLKVMLVGGSGSGTVTSVASADGSITVTNPTTTVDLSVVKAPILTTARTIGGVSFDGSANITVATATGGFTVSGGNLALGANSLTMTGSLAATGARVTKGWFTDVESTNMYTVNGTSLTTTAQTFQNKTITNSNNILGGVTMTLGSDADGDMYYRSSNVLTRLPKGTALQQLRMNAGATAPEWATITAGATAVTLIPRAADSWSGAQSTITINTNTTAFLGQVIVPFAITVNKISFKIGNTVTTPGTADISLYTENGQTQVFSVTTATIDTDSVIITTAVSSVAVAAGVYYIMINPNTTASFNALFYTSAPDPFNTTVGLPYDIASEPVMGGSLTITAGTPPATFDPTAVTQDNNRTLCFRLDN